MFRHSFGWWLSSLGLFVGFILIVFSIMLTMSFGSSKSWPFWLAGVVVTLVSAVFYYRAKAKDGQPDNPLEPQVNILGDAGRDVKLSRKDIESGQRLKPIYPESPDHPSPPAKTRGGESKK